jgi:Cysteinyl-tRNA synthetase
MLQAHYTSQLDFSNEALLAAEKGFRRLMEAFQKLDSLEPLGQSADFSVEAWRKRCYQAMSDDFNSPVLISELFEAARFINSTEQKIALSPQDLDLLRQSMHDFLSPILGLEPDLSRESGSNEKLDAAMQVLLDLRQKARADRNYALADAIRDQLAEAGLKIMDGADGSSYQIL